MKTTHTQLRKHPPTQRPVADTPPSLRIGQAALDEAARIVRAREAAVDAMLEMTFPASDPPSWTL